MAGEKPLTPTQWRRLERAVKETAGPGMAASVSGADLRALMNAARPACEVDDLYRVIRAADDVLVGSPEAWSMPLPDALATVGHHDLAAVARTIVGGRRKRRK